MISLVLTRILRPQKLYSGGSKYNDYPINKSSTLDALSARIIFNARHDPKVEGQPAWSVCQQWPEVHPTYQGLRPRITVLSYNNHFAVFTATRPCVLWAAPQVDIARIYVTLVRRLRNHDLLFQPMLAYMPLFYSPNLFKIRSDEPSTLPFWFVLPNNDNDKGASMIYSARESATLAQHQELVRGDAVTQFVVNQVADVTCAWPDTVEPLPSHKDRRRVREISLPFVTTHWLDYASIASAMEQVPFRPGGDHA